MKALLVAVFSVTLFGSGVAQTLTIPCTECVWRGTVSGQTDGFRYVGQLEFVPEAIQNGTQYSFHQLAKGQFRILDIQKVGGSERVRPLQVWPLTKKSEPLAQLNTDASNGSYELSVLFTIPGTKVESGAMRPSTLVLGSRSTSENRLTENNTRMKGEYKEGNYASFVWDLKLEPKTPPLEVAVVPLPMNQIFRGTATAQSLRGTKLALEVTLFPVSSQGNKVLYRAMGTVKPAALPPGEREDCKPALLAPYAFSKDTALEVDYATNTYVGLLEVNVLGLDRCKNKVVPWADEAQFVWTINSKDPWKDPALLEGNTRMKGLNDVVVKSGKAPISWDFKAATAPNADIEKMKANLEAVPAAKTFCGTCTWKGTVTGQTGLGASYVAEVVLKPDKVDGTTVRYIPNGTLRMTESSKAALPCMVVYPQKSIEIAVPAGQQPLIRVDFLANSYDMMMFVVIPVQISKCMLVMKSLEQTKSDQAAVLTYGVNANLTENGTHFQGKTQTVAWDFRLQNP
jgi:hypothetical protein